MDDIITYESIVEGVQLDFEDYIDEERLTVTQAISRIIEDEWKSLSKSMFVKYSYIVRLAIEGINRHELPDFLYDILLKSDDIIISLEDDEINALKNDLKLYRQKIEQDRYQIIETTIGNKQQVNYILTLDEQNND